MMLLRLAIFALALAAAPAAALEEPAEYTEMRRLLAEGIEKGVNHARKRSGGPAIDPRVIAAVRKVPRHEFAPPPLRPYAYLDRPLPVGRDATISQPSLVAMMTDLLRIRHGDKVLEVGTGGGYHTAILAEMTPAVVSVEFHPEVARAAKDTLERLGYRSVQVNVADGYYGWRPAAPYDAILVRMAVPDVPSALIEQLKPGGRLIAPVGPPDSAQVLFLLEKGSDGRVKETAVMPVIFRALPGGLRL
ncbi:MAG TPA: protein-L-isoaspartate(D-aspartate) O-methyltransferase [Burkholderiales bacterium]|nr:protein-L-isoaspartate(D-aspartate) O-methyltransferase [Burkholderiales bacterium]